MRRLRVRHVSSVRRERGGELGLIEAEAASAGERDETAEAALLLGGVVVVNFRQAMIEERIAKRSITYRGKPAPLPHADPREDGRTSLS